MRKINKLEINWIEIAFKSKIHKSSNSKWTELMSDVFPKLFLYI